MSPKNQQRQRLIDKLRTGEKWTDEDRKAFYAQVVTPRFKDPVHLDPESRYQLQCIDTNCNDCIHLMRDISRSKSKIKRGQCKKKSIEVSFMPNCCMPENDGCFHHRRAVKFETK